MTYTCTWWHRVDAWTYTNTKVTEKNCWDCFLFWKTDQYGIRICLCCHLVFVFKTCELRTTKHQFSTSNLMQCCRETGAYPRVIPQRWSTLWTSSQALIHCRGWYIQTYSNLCSHSHLWVIQSSKLTWPPLHLFGQCEEAGENPCRHMEKETTNHCITLRTNTRL